MVFEWPLTSTPLRPFVNGQMTSFWLACLKQVNPKQLLGILPEAG
jgi:hypothetical protein